MSPSTPGRILTVHELRAAPLPYGLTDAADRAFAGLVEAPRGGDLAFAGPPPPPRRRQDRNRPLGHRLDATAAERPLVFPRGCQRHIGLFFVSAPGHDMLADQGVCRRAGFEILTPKVRTRVGERWRTTPLFGCYFFARVVDQWRVLERTIGILAVVKAAGVLGQMPRRGDRQAHRPGRIRPDGVICLASCLTPQSVVGRAFEPGAKVACRRPFPRLRRDPHRNDGALDREMVLIDLLGRKRTVGFAAGFVLPHRGAPRHLALDFQDRAPMMVCASWPLREEQRMNRDELAALRDVDRACCWTWPARGCAPRSPPGSRQRPPPRSRATIRIRRRPARLKVSRPASAFAAKTAEQRLFESPAGASGRERHHAGEGRRRATARAPAKGCARSPGAGPSRRIRSADGASRQAKSPAGERCAYAAAGGMTTAADPERIELYRPRMRDGLSCSRLITGARVPGLTVRGLVEDSVPPKRRGFYAISDVSAGKEAAMPNEAALAWRAPGLRQGRGF